MDKLISQAKACLENEKFQLFSQRIYAMKYTQAVEIAQSNEWESEEMVLESVYKDECDFVLMDHYKKSVDLLEAVGNYVREKSDD